MTDSPAWLGALQEDSFARATATTNKSYPPQRRLTGEQLAALLDARQYAVIASARPDGRPHAALSVFVVTDGAIWLPTMTGAQRERNVRAHPWLTMVVSEGDGMQHAAVIIEGPAQIVDAPQTIRELAAKKNRGSVDWAETWLQLTPQRLLSFAEVEWTL